MLIIQLKEAGNHKREKIVTQFLPKNRNTYLSLFSKDGREWFMEWLLQFSYNFKAWTKIEDWKSIAVNIWLNT